MRAVARFLYTTLLCFSLLAAPCVAQESSEEEEAGKSYVMSYFLVGGGIGLGLVAVCVASKRRKDVRKPD